MRTANRLLPNSRLKIDMNKTFIISIIPVIIGVILGISAPIPKWKIKPDPSNNGKWAIGENKWFRSEPIYWRYDLTYDQALFVKSTDGKKSILPKNYGTYGAPVYDEDPIFPQVGDFWYNRNSQMAFIVCEHGTQYLRYPFTLDFDLYLSPEREWLGMVYREFFNYSSKNNAISADECKLDKEISKSWITINAVTQETYSDTELYPLVGESGITIKSFDENPISTILKPNMIWYNKKERKIKQFVDYQIKDLNIK